MNDQEHRGINYDLAMDALCKTILPRVLGVHELDIPYPAALFGVRSPDEAAEVPISEDGSVVFRVDEARNFVADYYFYHDGGSWEHDGGVWEANTVHLLGTDVKVPVTRSVSKPVARHNVPMLDLGAYGCRVSPWVGDLNVAGEHAVATLGECALLPFNTHHKPTFREQSEGRVYVDHHETRILELSAGDWRVDIWPLYRDKRQSLSEEAPYKVALRKESSTFSHVDLEEVLRVLKLLYSLSSEGWVYHTTVMVYARDDIRSAFVGQLGTRSWSRLHKVGHGEFNDWPTLFEGIWRHRKSLQMRSALYHLIECGDRLKRGGHSETDFPSATAALEASVRFWCGLHLDQRLSKRRLVKEIRKICEQFDMDGRTLDPSEVCQIVSNLPRYRNPPAHGAGGQREAQPEFALYRYCYLLARLLVLRKLGGSSGHPDGVFYAPTLALRTFDQCG